MKLKKIISSLLVATMFTTVLAVCDGNVTKAASSQETAVATTQPQGETPTEKVSVNIAPGKLTGFRNEGVYTFKGIPYATAERFQSPKPVTSYPNGAYSALKYGPVAPQASTFASTASTNMFEFATPSNGTADMVGNETCQYLNVWSSNLSAKKPVIVYFHGGGLSSGASSELSYYTGEYMAKEENVVFVSVNHRLNVLGYLDVSAYGEEYANSAIAGIEDCVVALRWVHDNIAQFGGNPSNVTIVGQSGGGVKVSTLACMSDTVGLFDKVFIMSGRTSNIPKEVGLYNTQKLVNYLGLKPEEVISTLVNMDFEDLYMAASKAGLSWSDTCYGNGTYETPMIDSNGKVNPYAAQRTWMIGSAFSEMNGNVGSEVMGSEASLNITNEEATKLLQKTYGSRTKSFINAFKAAYPGRPLSHAVYINNSLSGIRSRYALNRHILPNLNDAGVTVYNYVVAYTFPAFGGFTMYHSGDIGFWFHAIDTIPYLTDGDTLGALKTEAAMAGALASFAANGKPYVGGLEWKPWTKKAHNTMVFDVKSELKTDFDTKLYDIIAAATKK